jgi:hypothetical protein
MIASFQEPQSRNRGKLPGGFGELLSDPSNGSQRLIREDFREVRDFRLEAKKRRFFVDF